MYDRILVPIDGSEASDAGLAEAIRLARLSGGTVRLLHVVEEVPLLPASLFTHEPADRGLNAYQCGSAMVERRAARVRRAGVKAEVLLVEDGERRLQEHVARAVDAWPADIVVLGTHGRRGASRVVLGSDAEQIARKSRVPVLLAHAAGPAPAVADRTEPAFASEDAT
ncbi:MAG: universal stress protein [Burkholderiaceae bacterium]